MSTQVFENMALQNALAGIRQEMRFPHQVFAGEWVDYLFFHSDVLFEAHFVEIKNILLKEENASAIAVVNLGNVSSGMELHPQAIFLDRDTTAEEYIAQLMGDRSPNSWMFLKDRYVCSSDQGHWSIYCEKENDVAVLAVDKAMPRFIQSRLEKLMRARSIRAMQRSSNSHSFDFQILVPEWKKALLTEYRLPDQSA
jgi:hypothetical protein